MPLILLIAIGFLGYKLMAKPKKVSVSATPLTPTPTTVPVPALTPIPITPAAPTPTILLPTTSVTPSQIVNDLLNTKKCPVCGSAIKIIAIKGEPGIALHQITCPNHGIIVYSTYGLQKIRADFLALVIPTAPTVPKEIQMLTEAKKIIKNLQATNKCPICNSKLIWTTTSPGTRSAGTKVSCPTHGELVWASGIKGSISSALKYYSGGKKCNK